MSNLTDSAAMTISQANTNRWGPYCELNIQYQKAGSGSFLILMHRSGPGPSGWSTFNQNIGELATRFRVLALDLPGWEDPIVCRWRKQTESDALCQFMDALSIDRSALAGNATGDLVTPAFEVP